MIIIPMAGLSSRFFKAGFDKPKYQLDLQGQSVFSWAVDSFSDYYQSDEFIFICRDVFDTENFIRNEIKQLGIRNYQIVCLAEETLGQADTVYQGLKHLDSEEEIFIFNIDSKLLHFEKPSWRNQYSGYLEVFEGEGNHWSFIRLENDAVVEVAEKKRISSLCSDGLYHFSSINVYKDLFEQYAREEAAVNELYIAPMYNRLIKAGKNIHYHRVDSKQISFCGTPDEYAMLLAQE